MVVNPAYKGIKLPVDQWPLLSTSSPRATTRRTTTTACTTARFHTCLWLRRPWRLSRTSVNRCSSPSRNSTTVCSQVDGTSVGEKLVALGPETVGYRFMIGITPLADDRRYQLRAAALQTTNNTFVAPDNASLQAASALLKPDKATGTWPVPYALLSTDSAGAHAYPGTMVVYAAVPTSGLPASNAKDYASLLQFAATSGQSPGLGVAQLPPGYLPMTKANGLGALADYTIAAATDVAAQNGDVPSMTPVPPTTTVVPTTVAPTTVAPTTVPPTTVPPTTVPPTTVPPTTVPQTTVPPTTVPQTTVPPTTVPPTTVPPTTVPQTTTPQTTVPPTTVSPTTVPPTTIPATTVPTTTIPPSGSHHPPGHGYASGVVLGEL